jgi:hypothetical protein
MRRERLGLVSLLAFALGGATSAKAGYPLVGYLPREQDIMLLCTVSDTRMAKNCGAPSGPSASAAYDRTKAFIDVETDDPDYLVGATPGAQVLVMIHRSPSFGRG